MWATIVLAGLLAFTLPAMSSGIELRQLQQLSADYPDYQSDVIAVVDIGAQKLFYYRHGKLHGEYPVSTAKLGAGNRQGSNQTPPGLHYVRRKIGAGAVSGAIFKGRVNNGKVARIEPLPRHTGDDFVTTRILWLSGLEPGVNSGPGIDSFKRYIYIHGTHEEGLIGQPASHGCVRMRNKDVIELFDKMPEKSLVLIVSNTSS